MSAFIRLMIELVAGSLALILYFRYDFAILLRNFADYLEKKIQTLEKKIQEEDDKQRR